MTPPREPPTRITFDPVPIRGEPLSTTVIQERAERDDQLAGLTKNNTRYETNDQEQRD